MVTLPVQCTCYGSAEVIKAGKQLNDAQRYRCQNAQCHRTIFQLDYRDRGRLPAVKWQIVDMALNGRGIRNTARVLGIGIGTVMTELKKRSLQSSQLALGAIKSVR